MNIGDQVTVRIRGGHSGRQIGKPGGPSIGVGAGASMQVPGKIVADLGTQWLVELSISFGDSNRVPIAKEPGQ